MLVPVLREVADMIYKSEQGMGLIEVMVALLLLAIAVLGFSAMQMRAVKATDEALIRSDAMSAMRNISEDIRLNPDKQAEYQSLIGSVWTGLTDKTSGGYCTGVDNFKTAKNISSNPCNSTKSCTAEQQASLNVYQAMQTICDSQMMFNAVTCPGTSGSLQKVCLIVSWGDTVPEMSTASNACAKASGSYNRGASCLVMESY